MENQTAATTPKPKAPARNRVRAQPPLPEKALYKALVNITVPPLAEGRERRRILAGETVELTRAQAQPIRLYLTEPDVEGDETED